MCPVIPVPLEQHELHRGLFLFYMLALELNAPTDIKVSILVFVTYMQDFRNLRLKCFCYFSIYFICTAFVQRFIDLST